MTNVIKRATLVAALLASTAGIGFMSSPANACAGGDSCVATSVPGTLPNATMPPLTNVAAGYQTLRQEVIYNGHNGAIAVGTGPTGVESFAKATQTNNFGVDTSFKVDTCPTTPACGQQTTTFVGSLRSGTEAGSLAIHDRPQGGTTRAEAGTAVDSVQRQFGRVDWVRARSAGN